MRRLILLRHAKTEARAPSGRDSDRALTPRGLTDARLVASHLAQMGAAPEVVLVSTALRARQTWDCAAPLFPAARMEPCANLYNAAPEDVAGEIARSTGEFVMVIGHNPSLQELAYSLLDEGGGTAGQIEAVSAGFPTSTAALFHIDDNGAAVLECLVLARDLRPSAE